MELTKEQLEIKAGVVSGLRAMADFLENNPVLAPSGSISQWVYTQSAAELGEVASYATHAIKRATETEFDLTIKFSDSVFLNYWLTRSMVCESVEVGKEVKKIRKIVKEAVIEEVEEEVPVLEWKCPSILKAFKEKQNGEDKNGESK